MYNLRCVFYSTVIYCKYNWKPRGMNMKKLILFLFGIAVSCYAVFSFGQMQGSSANMITVLQRLNQAGYTKIHEIEYKRGTYEVKAYNAQCRKIKFRVNPKNMRIPSLNQSRQLSMLQVAQRVQAAGYTHIYDIEFDNGRYDVKAYDKNGNKTKLTVNPSTGGISRGWF